MIRFPCSICGCEMGWARPSGVCSEACLKAGANGTPLPPTDEKWCAAGEEPARQPGSAPRTSSGRHTRAASRSRT